VQNKFHILGVEAPVWQGAQAQENRDISALGQHRQAGCINAKNNCAKLRLADELKTKQDGVIIFFPRPL
jgi:hypothetical protein